MQAEEKARTILLRYIKKLISVIDFKGTLSENVTKLCDIELYETLDFPYPQLPLFFPALLHQILSYDEIQLSFVKGDYKKSNLFLNKLKNIYNSYIDLITSNITGQAINKDDIAKLRFPLANTTKQEEILLLKGLDSSYRTQFIKNLIYCENVKSDDKDIKLVNCNECVACKNFRDAYSSLNLPKGDIFK